MNIITVYSKLDKLNEAAKVGSCTLKRHEKGAMLEGYDDNASAYDAIYTELNELQKIIKKAQRFTDAECTKENLDFIVGQLEEQVGIIDVMVKKL